MKKPFNETKAGKLVNSTFVKTALSLVPFGLGSIASNILDSNATASGNVDPKTMPIKLMKVVIYAILIYFVFSGKISQDQADTAKDFITQ